MEKFFEQMKHEVYGSFSEDAIFKTPILNSPKLWDTELYKFCEAMPKGADLHAHGGALTPAKSLINFVSANQNLLIDTSAKHKGFLQLSSKNPGSTYVPLKKALDDGILNEDEIVNLWTLKGRPNNTDIWDWFQMLFEKHNDLNEVGPTCKDYFKYSYEYYCKHNIFHLEQRLFLKNSEEEAFEKAHCAYDAYIEAKQKFPELTVRIIPVGLKSPVFDMSVTQNIFDNAAIMNERVKDGDDDFVVGIDLVNEEDTSRSIADFAELVNSTIEKAPRLNVNLHAGESNNPNNNEIAEAIKLNSKRIGHGLNLKYHSELIDTIKEKNICLEVCPVSNQILGYCDDLRQHPAKDYFYDGVPMVLCSDDPTYQENSTLSDDFFMAILAWDLSLDDVKQLTYNSIKYSYLSENLKQKKLIDLTDKWNRTLSQLN